ncbi:MAG: phage major tail tube protein [Gammaproteobacteria bacterium]|nr:MAG: phage major tail tube protein [Gammaproteobacteria bacterium]
MKLPSKIKHFNFFLDGDNYVGRALEIEPPKFTRKMEEYRGGGMNAPLKMDMGLEGLEMSVTMGGLEAEMMRHMGACRHDAIKSRFAGSLAADDSCDTYPLEIETTGRYEEIELPNAKSGEDTEHKFKLALSYVRIIYNGTEVCEIDIPNMVEKWYGKDRLEEHKRNIGA